jgi:hypothetical protein
VASDHQLIVLSLGQVWWDLYWNGTADSTSSRRCWLSRRGLPREVTGSSAGTTRSRVQIIWSFFISLNCHLKVSPTGIRQEKNGLTCVMNKIILYVWPCWLHQITKPPLIDALNHDVICEQKSAEEAEWSTPRLRVIGPAMSTTKHLACYHTFGGLTLYWIECQYLKILILRFNANISVWMFRYSEPRLDIEVECQMLFGLSNWTHTSYWMVQMKTAQPKFHVRNRNQYASLFGFQSKPWTTQTCSLWVCDTTPQTHELLKLQTEHTALFMRTYFEANKSTTRWS